MDDDGPDLVFGVGSTAAQQGISVKQAGTVSGALVRVGGTGDTVPVQLDSRGTPITGCRAQRGTAKQLARHLFEPVRLFGEGRWTRNAEGTWDVGWFLVERFEPLDPATLSEVLDGLRGVAAAWPEGLHLDLEVLRGAGRR